MKRRILIGLLSFGTLAGFAGGFFQLGMRSHERRAQFESHVADVCAEAALRSASGRGDWRERREHQPSP